MTESDYEEIGPPLSRAGGGGVANNVKQHNGAAAPAARSTCDLCGTSTAMVKCRLCSEQVFCLACDDMYHRHPKRSSHPRKVRLLFFCGKRQLIFRFNSGNQ